MKRPLLFVPGKRRYVRGERPKVDCILCSVRRGDHEVERLVIAEDTHVFITMNLFPYNPGHVMIVPNRHFVDPRECTPAERRSLDAWTRKLLDVLDEIYEPSGYNVGCNIGQSSGASIAHFHLHIVPRFRNEIGFIDVIAGTRVHVDDPKTAVTLISEALAGKKPSRRSSGRNRKKG